MTKKPFHIAFIYGTRPEAIKIAPIIRKIKDNPSFGVTVISTGQHQEMLSSINSFFQIKPDYDLEVFSPKQNLNQLSKKIFESLEPLLGQVKPDAILVQGDTTTVAISSLVAFYMHIPIIHLEAGLRSGDLKSPFPEEANRKIVTQIATLHLAPTNDAKQNLLRENIPEDSISVVGNTVIDSLFYAIEQPVKFSDDRIQGVFDSTSSVILFTCHRRENWGEPMKRVGQAIANLSRQLPDWQIIFPAHSNPLVRETLSPYLDDCNNVIICEPLNYDQFAHMMQRASIILSDSGGVQEEAPALDKPVLVLRETTERPEAIKTGAIELIGTQTSEIINQTLKLIEDKDEYRSMATADNPFGSGNSADLAITAIERTFLN